MNIDSESRDFSPSSFPFTAKPARGLESPLTARLDIAVPAEDGFGGESDFVDMASSLSLAYNFLALGFCIGETAAPRLGSRLRPPPLGLDSSEGRRSGLVEEEKEEKESGRWSHPADSESANSDSDAESARLR